MVNRISEVREGIAQEMGKPGHLPYKKPKEDGIPIWKASSIRWREKGQRVREKGQRGYSDLDTSG